MNKDYQPIPMRPLTMRGVFGITWAVTKRHFFAGVMYTLIWVLIAAAVLALCAAPAVIGIVANNAGQEGGVAALVALSVILMFVAALAIWLVLGPIMNGGFIRKCPCAYTAKAPPFLSFSGAPATRLNGISRLIFANTWAGLWRALPFRL